MLAPAAIRTLMRDQPIGRATERGGARRRACGRQRLAHKERRIREIDAPEALVRAVRELPSPEHVTGAPDGTRDSRRSCRGIVRAVSGKRLYRGRSAFRVGQLGHALAEHLRRIHRFQ